MIRSISVTDSTGYSPAAVSAESIRASAPSYTAVATSEASARVGAGLRIIDSSIWVATTTGLPARRAARMIRFCRPGTSSGGSSTPRSPRAIMMPSARSMISSRWSTAAGFSTLTMIAARPAIRRRASVTSSGRCTKLRAIQSIAEIEREAQVLPVLLGQRR